MRVEIPTTVCLGVAIDHRIRQLCRPVAIDSCERSEHVTRIHNLGNSLLRSQEEIQVTTQLAGLAVKGGIAITLQQPRHDHPFGKGIDCVIEDCATLHALDDVFTAVSCDTLDIRTNISVVDLLPYMAEEITEVPDADLTRLFKVSAQTICDKEPGVLLCAGKIWLPVLKRANKIKGDSTKFESIGLGRTFGSTEKLPSKVRIRQDDGSLVSIPRVNGFHPSYAMNYRAHNSLLRQLLILIGAEACGMLRDDWVDKGWMTELRAGCRELCTPIYGKVSFRLCIVIKFTITSD
jgi:hypothetical protein